MSLDSTGALTEADGGMSPTGLRITGSGRELLSDVSSETSWSFLFAPRSKVEFVSRRLGSAFPVFIHKDIVYERKDKRIVKEEKPTVSGLVFVQGDSRKIQTYLTDNFYGLYLAKNCSTRRIAVISDKEMQPFMRMAQINPTRIRFMLHPFDYYSEGNVLVKITSGVLAGLEGYRIRIARDRCFVTTLGGMTIAIGGVHKESFENLGEYAGMRKAQASAASPLETAAWTPLQKEIDRCFFKPESELDVLAISQALAPWIAKANSLLAAKEYEEAVEVASFILEEIGGYFSAPCSLSQIGNLRHVNEMAQTVGGVLRAISSAADAPCTLCELAAVRLESAAVRFPFLRVGV